MQRTVPRTRFEALVLAYLYENRDQGVTEDEIKRIARTLATDGFRSALLPPPRDEREVINYINYLVRRGKVKRVNGRYYLIEENLTRPMRIVVRSLVKKYNVRSLLR